MPPPPSPSSSRRSSRSSSSGKYRGRPSRSPSTKSLLDIFGAASLKHKSSPPSIKTTALGSGEFTLRSEEDRQPVERRSIPRRTKSSDLYSLWTPAGKTTPMSSDSTLPKGGRKSTPRRTKSLDSTIPKGARKSTPRRTKSSRVPSVESSRAP